MVCRAQGCRGLVGLVGAALTHAPEVLYIECIGLKSLIDCPCASGYTSAMVWAGRGVTVLGKGFSEAHMARPLVVARFTADAALETAPGAAGLNHLHLPVWGAFGILRALSPFLLPLLGSSESGCTCLLLVQWQGFSHSRTTFPQWSCHIRLLGLWNENLLSAWDCFKTDSNTRTTVVRLLSGCAPHTKLP
jgi:hypothetical protein